MTLKEAFDQGACKVGNLIILEGGKHFLIGDCTTETSPDDCYMGCIGWDGWLGQTVLFVFDLLDDRACAILEQYKSAAAIPAVATEPSKDQENGNSPASQD